MSWQCKLIEYEKKTTGQTLQIGDMFYGPTEEMVKADEGNAARIGWYWPWHFCRPESLSDYYKQNNVHRRPLMVFLPGRILHCVDSANWKTVDGKLIYYGGWTVTGIAPNITVHPSINCVGAYHGWLQNGIISPDCEGRLYDEIGNIIK
jgi:hypothetical protein